MSRLRRLCTMMFAITFVGIAVASLTLAWKFDFVSTRGKLYACRPLAEKMSSTNFRYWELRCDQIALSTRENIRTYFIEPKDVLDISEKCGLDSRTSLVALHKFFMREIIAHSVINSCKYSIIRDISRYSENVKYKTRYYSYINRPEKLYNVFKISLKNHNLPLTPFMSAKNDNVVMYFCANVKIHFYPRSFGSDILQIYDTIELLPYKKMIEKCRV